MNLIILVIMGIILFALVFVLSYINYNQLEKDEVRIIKHPKEIRIDKQVDDILAYTRMSGKARRQYLKDFVPDTNDYVRYVVTVKGPKGQIIDVAVFYRGGNRKEK
jgi:uncharacterized membrane protein